MSDQQDMFPLVLLQAKAVSGSVMIIAVGSIDGFH